MKSESDVIDIINRLPELKRIDLFNDVLNSIDKQLDSIIRSMIIVHSLYRNDDDAIIAKKLDELVIRYKEMKYDYDAVTDFMSSFDGSNLKKNGFKVVSLRKEND